MNRSLAAILAVSMLSLAGCDVGDAEQPKPTSSAASAPAAIADGEIAVQADFEDEAEKLITVATYKAEVDALEKEISD